MTESLIITAVIEAMHQGDVMRAHFPNTFVQNDIDQKQMGQKEGCEDMWKLINMSLEMSPETYVKYVVYKGNSKILYVVAEKAL
jgi:hypothetical protein